MFVCFVCGVRRGRKGRETGTSTSLFLLLDFILPLTTNTPTPQQTNHQDATLEYHDMETMKHMFEVNYFGLVRVSQAFLPLLRASKGRLINVGSVAGAWWEWRGGGGVFACWDGLD